MTRQLLISAVLTAAGTAVRADNCPLPVQNLTAEICRNTGAINVSWSAVPHATSYRVYGATEPFLPANNDPLGIVSTTSFAHTPSQSTFWYYWVESASQVIGCPPTIVGPVVGLLDHGPLAQPNATFTTTCAGVEVRLSALPEIPMAAIEILVNSTPDRSGATVLYNSLQTGPGGGVPMGPLTYLVPSLPGVTRYCWVRVVGPCRASPVTPHDGVTVPPLMTYPISPPVVTASQNHCDEIVLTWPAVRNSTHYQVERLIGENVDATWTVPGSPFVDAAPVTPEMVTAGRSADYRVTAFNVCGERAVSAVVTGRQPAAFFLDPVQGLSTPVGGAAILHAENYGMSNLRWTLNGQPVVPGGRITVLGTTLTISPVTQADAGVYVVSGDRSCTSPLPGPTTTIYLAVATTCPADFNGSGHVSVQDIFDFLAAYFAGCP